MSDTITPRGTTPNPPKTNQIVMAMSAEIPIAAAMRFASGMLK